MSDIDVTFSRKANNFSRGELRKVIATLAERSTIRVGEHSFEFVGRQEPEKILHRYFSGLRMYGYSHTYATVLFQKVMGDDTAYALVEYVHSNYDSRPLDTLEGCYFLARGADGEWQVTMAEFLEEPLGFAV